MKETQKITKGEIIMSRKCNPKSQKNRIINHLINNKSITSWEAFSNYGVTRLSSIIYNLRHDGYKIESIRRYTRSIHSGEPCTYAEYRLI